MHAHTHTCAHTHTHKHTCTDTHTHTHAHMRAHTHSTHTHTVIQYETDNKMHVQYELFWKVSTCTSDLLFYESQGSLVWEHSVR